MRSGVLLLLAALLVAGGCREDGASPAGKAPSPTAESVPVQPTQRPSTYVALGDSYTSGAGTPGSPTAGCRRSSHDYGALAAASLGATYVDASCPGARTEHVVRPQPFSDGGSVPPQLDAVPVGADLVSVGLGLNDRGFLRNLTRPGRDETASQPRASAVAYRVEAVLRLVAERAPAARLLLVGYPQLVPPSGTGPELRWTADEAAVARAAFATLDAELRAAAGRAGVIYVDVSAASAGHDVCAGAAAWVNGARPDPGVAAPYHPFQREQEAVAALVVAAAGS